MMTTQNYIVMACGQQRQRRVQKGRVIFGNFVALRLGTFYAVVVSL